MVAEHDRTRILLMADERRGHAVEHELSGCDESFVTTVTATVEGAVSEIARARPHVIVTTDSSSLDALHRAADVPIVLILDTPDAPAAARAIADGAIDVVVLGEHRSLAWRLKVAIDRHPLERGLRKARTLAERANTRKSEFLSSVSHEIRTPLNTVLGMAELLGETQLSDKQDRYVATLKRAGDHLLALIDDVLDLARIEAGHLTINDVGFDIHEVAESAVEMLRSQARRKKLDIGWDALDVPHIVRGDPRRIRQVLVNLLSNAVKFTAQGRVWLSIRRDPSAVDSVAALRFSVVDTGMGIPADRIHAIFDGFVQGDRSIEPRYGGFGLGLNISKRIVDRMGGRIWAESREGEGAAFHVTLALPLEHGTASPSFSDVKTSTDVRLRTLSGDPLRVLVVDDSEDNRVLLGEYLRGAEAEVEFADDGPSAIEKGRSGRFDVVLMDLQMPHLDGYETTRQLLHMWRDAGAKVPPVIALSAHTLADSFARAMEAGCTSQLTKPIRKRVLLEAVARAAGATVRERREEPERPLRARVAEDLRPLLPRFFANRRKDVRTIRDAAARSDFSLVSTLAHNMRGTGGSYGFPGNQRAWYQAR